MLGGTRFPFSSLSDRAFDRLFYISDTTLSAYNQPPCVYTLESVYSIYYLYSKPPHRSRIGWDARSAVLNDYGKRYISNWEGRGNPFDPKKDARLICRLNSRRCRTRFIAYSSSSINVWTGARGPVYQAAIPTISFFSFTPWFGTISTSRSFNRKSSWIVFRGPKIHSNSSIFLLPCWPRTTKSKGRGTTNGFTGWPWTPYRSKGCRTSCCLLSSNVDGWPRIKGSKGAINRGEGGHRYRGKSSSFSTSLRPRPGSINRSSHIWRRPGWSSQRMHSNSSWSWSRRGKGKACCRHCNWPRLPITSECANRRSIN